MKTPLLHVRDLCVHFPLRHGRFFDHAAGVVKAVEGVSFAVAPGEVLGLVGESGCGKSTLSRAILRIVPTTQGEIDFEGHDLLAMTPHALLAVRPRLQMVFQDPFASLNPRMTIAEALAEPLRVHRLVSSETINVRVNQLLERVGLDTRFAGRYPHEFSGGQRQRIAIARALALQPRLLVADEPVSALDVSVQAQILNLLGELVRADGLAMILVSHDLAVVRHLADRIAVMYLGHIVEIGETESVLRAPLHPYTQALISAVPDPDYAREKARIPILLRGDPPSPINPPSGCPFHPRCPLGDEVCTQVPPPFVHRANQQAACFKIRF